MGLRLRRSAGASSGSPEQPVEEWPFLDRQVLVKSRSRKVCMTCHWFRHHSGVNCIPLLSCQLHQGLLAPFTLIGCSPQPVSKQSCSRSTSPALAR